MLDSILMMCTFDFFLLECWHVLHFSTDLNTNPHLSVSVEFRSCAKVTNLHEFSTDYRKPFHNFEAKKILTSTPGSPRPAIKYPNFSFGDVGNSSPSGSDHNADNSVGSCSGSDRNNRKSSTFGRFQVDLVYQI